MLLLVILAVVPALGLALQGGLRDRQASLDGAHDEAMELALLTASSNLRLVNETRQVLAGLARIPAIRETQEDACDELLALILHNNALYSDLAVVDLNGEVTCSATPLVGRLNLGDRRFFQQVVSTGEFAATEYGYGRISGRGALLMGYPLLDEAGRVRAVLHAGLDLSWLSSLAADMRFPSAAKMIVFDRDATIWLQYPLTGPAVGPVTGSGSVRSQLARQPEGSGEYVSAQGIQYLYAYAPLKTDAGAEPTAFVSVSVERDEILSAANAALTRNMLSLGLVALLALAAAWFGGQVFVFRRLQALMRATARVAAGDLGARSGLSHGAGELGELAYAFDEMAAALQRQSSERRQAEDERTQLVREQAARIEAERAQEQITSILESITDGFVVVDREWRLAYVNSAAAPLFGGTVTALVGCSFWEACPPALGSYFAELYQRAATERSAVQFEAHDEVTGRWLEVHAAPARDGLLVYMRDVTHRALAQQELNRLAFRDPLTDLPNRALFLERLEHALVRAERDGHAIAVLFIDLDNFKVVNDSLGHSEGDRLLIEVANRLRSCLRASDTVARFGGDEFTVLVEDATDGGISLAERLADSLRVAIVLQERDVFISASIGLAVSGGRDNTPGGLLRNADLAMYRAKAAGKARYVVFEQLDEPSPDEPTLLSA